MTGKLLLHRLRPENQIVEITKIDARRRTIVVLQQHLKSSSRKVSFRFNKSAVILQPRPSICIVSEVSNVFLSLRLKRVDKREGEKKKSDLTDFSV